MTPTLVHTSSYLPTAALASSVASVQAQPEFVRLPKAGDRCPVSGLCRSTLYGLISGVHPCVRSLVIRKRGASRGIRLIHVPSLLAHLNEMMQEQETVHGQYGAVRESSQKISEPLPEAHLRSKEEATKKSAAETRRRGLRQESLSDARPDKRSRATSSCDSMERKEVDSS